MKFIRKSNDGNKTSADIHSSKKISGQYYSMIIDSAKWSILVVNSIHGSARINNIQNSLILSLCDDDTWPALDNQ